MGQLRVMGKDVGDLRMTWNANNTDETNHAKATFDEMRGKGFLAYAVNEDGSKGEVIREFDPNAQKIIMAPPMAGG